MTASDQVVKPTGDAGGAPAEPARPPGIFANRDFLRLWTGETVSLMGTQVTQFAMPLVAILTLNASVFQVGVLNAMRFVPVLVISLFVGVWLDRRRRRPVLVACALGNAVLIGLVPLASVTGLLSIGLLDVVVLLVGTLTVVFDVGALSYVPDLVGRDRLAEGNSRLQASQAVAGISGPGLAGLLVSLLTAPITLTVDAVSYLFSAAGLLTIRRPESPPDTTRRPVGRSIAEGFRAVFGTRLLRSLLTQSVVLNLFYGAVFTIFMVYAVRVVRLSPTELGVVVGAAAVGGLAGSLTAPRVRRLLGLGRTMAVTTIGVSGGPLLLLVPRHAGPAALAILIAAQFVYGGSIAMFNVNAITLRQAVTPHRLLARMNATYRMLIFGAAPVGAMAGGFLGNLVGLRTALVVSLVAMVSPVLWIFFGPVYRLRDVPPMADDTPTPVNETDNAHG